ncbi:MAG: glycosyltransferase [Candidatus Thiodiazotropha endolucinida]|nr:glycosyltransferase [Candidatus Thiodiazotropha taylori]MCW4318371.1 glycosyltransferase [Candidatus Thiodiazotropha taylori]
MKILIVSNLYYPDHEGGAEKVARRTAEALAVKHDVLVLSTMNNLNSHNEDKISYKIKRVIYRNIYQYSIKQSSKSIFSRLIWHINNSINGVDDKEIASIFKKFKPDVVYLHNSLAFVPQLTNYCNLNNIPICLHLHDYSLICPKTSMHKRGRNCRQQCMVCRTLTFPARYSIRTVKSVIAVSEYLKSRHQKNNLFPNSKWHVVRNIENKESALPLYKKKPKDNLTIKIGFIGAITPVKGISNLIDSFISIDSLKLRLYIAGTGNTEYVNELKAISQDYPIVWLGQVQPDEFYEDIDCLVVSSLWHEPQALVIVEAINRGIPIIATRRGGNTEMVEIYKAGMLYEPDNKNELKNILKKISNFTRHEWRSSIPSRYPGLTNANQLAVNESKIYYKKIEKILVNSVTKIKYQ